MPRVSTKSCSRVFQWLELQPFRRKPDLATESEQAFTICRNEVCHRVTFPSMAVEPESTVHCEDHSVEAIAEFAKCGCRVSGHTMR